MKLVLASNNRGKLAELQAQQSAKEPIKAPPAAGSAKPATAQPPGQPVKAGGK